MTDTDKYAELVKQVTAVVREADRAFESSGGSSRHWVREQFLPRLEDAGLAIVQQADLTAANARIKELEWAIPCRNCVGCTDATKCTPWLTWDEYKTAERRLKEVRE